MIPAYIGLGGNLGDRLANLRRAVELLAAADAITLVACSRVYETEPVGFVDQPAFFNAVVAIETTLSPAALLETLLDIERKMGRHRQVRWGPRTIDLDLLLYGKEQVKSKELIVPHPRMAQRRFVLVPLAEIGAAVPVPGTGCTVAELLARCPDRSQVTPILPQGALLPVAQIT